MMVLSNYQRDKFELFETNITLHFGSNSNICRNEKTMSEKSAAPVTAIEKPLGHRLADWIEDPLGGVIAASVATMGSLGIVLLGSWSIHTVIN